MSALINDRLRSVDYAHFEFWCPGCKDTHIVDKRWTFDGNYDAPTIAPSLRVRSGHFIPAHKPGSRCWCHYNAEHPEEAHPIKCVECHSFVRAGNIEFLADCTHALAGQTVPIPPLPDFLRG